MSINCFYRYLSSKAIDVLFNHPELVDAVKDADVSDMTTDDWLIPPQVRSMVSKLPADIKAKLITEYKARLGTDSPCSQAIEKAHVSLIELTKLGISASDLGSQLSIQKEWEGLHFLLTDNSQPNRTLLSDVIMGGTPVGDIEKNGDCRILLPSQVAEAAEALMRISDDTVRARYDPAKMNSINIYPNSWDELSLEPMVTALRDIRGYFQEAADKGYGMLLYFA